MITTQIMNNSPARKITGKVELYQGSTLADTFNYNDVLMEVKISRIGKSAFFGFGVGQKLEVKITAGSVSKGDILKPYFDGGSGYVSAFPNFTISEAKRDENTNNLTITAYDALEAATRLHISDLTMSFPCVMGDYAIQIAQALGCSLDYTKCPSEFNTTYTDGANFEGTETLREALDDLAEASQTIYYIDSNNELIFKRLTSLDVADFIITKADYFNLKSKSAATLTAITHATELGDNVEASNGMPGATQYVRDNAFWELREDIADMVESALDNVGGLTIQQFEMDWRGNYLTEIGDKFGVFTKDEGIIYSYILNDEITYAGGFKQKTQWTYEDTPATASNPSTLGESLKQTYARVDKVNKEIEIVASETDTNKSQIAALQINTDSITSSVSRVEKAVEEGLGEISNQINELSSKVQTQLTPDDLTIEVQKQISNGVSKVETTTGFTFDEAGLTVSKTNSEISTQITENGMTVSKNNTPVLTANNEGVKAEDLHATTFLVIGKNSRLEDYGNRTACFWIGG